MTSCKNSCENTIALDATFMGEHRKHKYNLDNKYPNSKGGVMTKTTTKMQLDWQLAVFFLIAYAIAWPIAFIFGVDDESIRSTYSPIVAVNLIYLPKFAFTISGVIMFWVTGQSKEMWTRLFHWKVKWKWYALAYLGPALLYLASAWVSSDQPLSPRFDSSTLWMLTVATQSGILFYFLFRGGLGEEIGLRGFALTRL